MIAEFLERYGGKWVSLWLGLGAMTALTCMMTFSAFRVKSTVVERDYDSPPPLIDEQALARRLAWAHGQNVFRLNGSKLAEQVEAEPSVQSAAVNVSVDGRVVVRVTYRRPVANWKVGDRSYLVDGAAKLVAEGWDASLPLTIDDLGGTQLKPGDPVSMAALEAAYKLQRNLPVMGVSPARIAYSGARGLVVTDAASREILFGPPELLAAKLVALKAVLDDAAREGHRISRVDLRPVDRPAYKVFGED